MYQLRPLMYYICCESHVSTFKSEEFKQREIISKCETRAERKVKTQDETKKRRGCRVSALHYLRSQISNINSGRRASQLRCGKHFERPRWVVM